MLSTLTDDVILSTMFMRKHSITLDFKCDEVQGKGTILDTIIEGPNTFKQARRHAMQPHPPKDEWLLSGPAAAHKKQDLDKDGPSLTWVQPPSVWWQMVEVQEVDNVDKPCATGLRLLDPILLGPKDDLENSNNLEEIVHEFTWDQFPNGPNFEKEEFEASVQA
jgi:hypothetical protein